MDRQTKWLLLSKVGLFGVIAPIIYLMWHTKATPPTSTILAMVFFLASGLWGFSWGRVFEIRHSD